MAWLRKHGFLIVLIFFVYIAFFIFHLKPQRHFVQVLGARSHLSLFEQPEDGKKPILDAIHSAQREILIEMYLLTDKEIINALMQAREKGIHVQVMLEQHPFGANTVNNKTKKTLEDAHIEAIWTNPTFPLTHEKGMVIDDNEALILNQNLTAAAFSKNREFDIIDDNPQDVREIKNMFVADWNRQSFIPTASHILESPDTDRQTFITLLQHATNSIDIEMEILEDKEIINLLMQKAKRTQTRIILPDFAKVQSNQDTAYLLQQAGVLVETMKKPYVHAKMILVDDSQAYIGSINFSSQSMDQNRELGILISQDDIVQKISNSFENDWEKGTTL